MERRTAGTIKRCIDSLAISRAYRPIGVATPRNSGWITFTNIYYANNPPTAQWGLKKKVV